MSCYEALAGAYDALTEDVGYAQRADFLEKLLRRSAIPVKLVLDLACGTGTMTWLLTQRGYEVIGVDGSEDMLAAAMSKGGQAAGVPPVFLHQSMPKLDLYGTVDAAVCCLDSLNYLTDPEDVLRTVMSDFDLKILETCPVEYRCYCSRERVERALISLGRTELEQMLSEQGGCQLTCQFCDAVYEFTAEDIQRLLKNL